MTANWGREPPPRSGASEFGVTVGLVLVTWAALSLLQLMLFLRPTPYGTPYVQLTDRYLPFALIWDLWAATLPALPFLALWIFRWVRPVADSAAREGHRLLLAILILTVLLEHVDHELMRFMGIHLSWSVVRTYGDVAAWPDDMYALFAGDPGGPWLPWMLIPAIVIGVGGSGWYLVRRDARRPWPTTQWGAAGVVFALLLGPGVVRALWPGGNRWRRVQPATFAVVRESWRAAKAGTAPADYADLVGEYHKSWLDGEINADWRFTDPDFPLVRAPAGGTVAMPDRWNVIYLQLETFRGWDTGFLRPDRVLSPTPFLDSLASDTGSAVWVRFLSFGPETVNGLFASHCSVKPHRQFSPTAMFRGHSFLCLPEVLRRHGWHTALATGIDPDWDFQTPWLQSWYEELSLPVRIEEPDREVFHRAVTIARRLGSADNPFLLTVLSYSNHVPFRSREPTLDLVRSTRPDSAIWNTMHYTDDVVREFVDSLRREPWMDHTILVVTGDHGANFGEHDGSAGQRNGFRETVWVPLLIAGGHPRLPRGRHGDVASLLDIAPTVMELLGIRDTVPWMGHSLTEPVPPARQFCGARSTARFAERGSWSFVGSTVGERPMLFDAVRDPLQQHDLGATFPDTARILDECVRREQALIDYLLVRNRIWPLQAGG